VAHRSKFAGAPGRVKQPEGAAAEVERGVNPRATPPISTAEPAPVKGRRGKRSDPAYSPTTFFVRKETKKKATRILLDDAHAGKDLSDLVEELLSEWVSKQANVV
jgi:hypothetical protein